MSLKSLSKGRLLVAAPDDDPKMKMHYGSWDFYRQLRAQEPQLVSIADDAKAAALECVSFSYQGQEAACSSVGCFVNEGRREARNLFGRLDLVMVAKPFRGFGLGRIAIFAGLIQMLAAFGPQLYSLSCLAGHKAVAHVLSQLGMTLRSDRQSDFDHYSMELRDHKDLLGRLEELLALQWLASSYKLRQGGPRD